MKQTTIRKSVFMEVEKAVEKVKKLIPQLSEAERATLELLLDEEAQKNIAISREEIKRGHYTTLDEFKKS